MTNHVWKREAAYVDNASYESIINEDDDTFLSVLSIKNATKDDEGNYECTLTNSLGEKTHEIFVTVEPERPIDGGWSEWSELSICSRTCGRGYGYKKKTRECNNPKPKNGGIDCDGFKDFYEYCELSKC